MLPYFFQCNILPRNLEILLWSLKTKLFFRIIKGWLSVQSKSKEVSSFKVFQGVMDEQIIYYTHAFQSWRYCWQEGYKILFGYCLFDYMSMLILKATTSLWSNKYSSSEVPFLPTQNSFLPVTSERENWLFTEC